MSEDWPRPGTFIQWKGTKVCMDVHCLCGEDLHFDTDFAYEVGCSECGRVYSVGTAVELREIEPEDPSFVKWSDCTNWNQ